MNFGAALMIINTSEWERPKLKTTENLSDKVEQILQDILLEGDAAVDRFSEKFDQQKVKLIDLKPFEEYGLDAQLAESIKFAANRIKRFAKFQKQNQGSRDFTDEYGTYSQVVSPIERVGAYIPGGRYPLISTALMTLIPAKVAGSPVRIACSPSDNPAILAAASLAGATQFIQVGGVQAIGALSFGYRDIQPVDVIVGPGNEWVNEAKKQVQSRVKIDGLAGPSELLAICDNNTNIEWLTLDALAQAEHDPLACSIIISDDSEWLKSVSSYIEKQEDAQKLVSQNQVELIFVESQQGLIDFSNQYAPEHLLLCHKNIHQEQLTNYGSLFIGENSAVALGDYISGPNHTLPTLGYARQNGGLNVNTFLRVLTTQSINDKGRKILSEKAMSIAQAEGLNYHFDSLKVRRE